MLRAIRSAVAVVALAACGASSSGSGGAAATPTCAVEDVVAANGTCVGPGVPPGGCDPGFTYDGNGGCDPILPAADCGEGEMAVPGDTECHAVGAAGDPPTCPSGQMALPGETSCHELADCGAAPWGNIPVDATTQYVDGSYAGGASDGSASKPWTTIGAGVTAAAAGAVVAVAAGSYAESVSIEDKAVHLWGRCPSMVEIAGTDANTGAVGAATKGTEIHTIALTGVGIGAALGPASMVVLESVWLHDTAADGIETFGSATVRGSLVERAAHVGIGLYPPAGNLSIDGSVVRDVASAADGSLGHGIDADQGTSLAVTGSVFERNHEAQFAVGGGRVTIDGCVVRDTLPNTSNKTGGSGVFAQFEGVRTTLTVLESTFEWNAGGAIVSLGSDVVVWSTLIRDTQPQASDLRYGEGLEAQVDPSSKQPASVTAMYSLVERSRYGGAVAIGGRLTLDHCVVRDTLPQESDGTFGVGVQAEIDEATKLRASLTVSRSLLERNRTVGLAVIGADAAVDSLLVRDMLPRQSDATGGHAIEVATDPAAPMLRGTLKLTGSVITRSRGIGVAAFSADLVIDRTVVSSTQPDPSASEEGYGLQVLSSIPGVGPANLTLARSLVADNVGSGLLATSANAMVSRTWVRGVAPRPSIGDLGDGMSADGDAVLTVSSCRIENSARAGLSMFDTAQVNLSSTTLACDSIPLDGEDRSAFTNGGSLVCSCAGSTTGCQVLTSNLQPPQPIAPTAP